MTINIWIASLVLDHCKMMMIIKDIIGNISYGVVDDDVQEGRPTRDPRKYKAGGALLPAGGPKVFHDLYF